jgi:hypothetical protein
MLLSDTRICVVCHQSLPWKSKMTVALIPQEEAEQNQWPGLKHPDQTVTVDMCIPRQMDRSRSAKKSAAHG